jgi:F-type H+-transporting ATPase subunit gamma
MAGAQERTLRRRVRSIQSTRKTTRAMELIASARIPRAQARIQAARPYAERLEQLAADLAAAPGPRDHPLLAEPDPSSPIALVVIAGDRGLSGPYNPTVLRAAEARLRALGSVPVQLLLVGRRAGSYFRFQGLEAAHLWTGMADRHTHTKRQEQHGKIIKQILLFSFFIKNQSSIQAICPTKANSPTTSYTTSTNHSTYCCTSNHSTC